MLGIDLTNVKRFENIGLKFAQRILSKREYEEFLISENQALFLARSWAIKEAIYKADNNYFSFKEIELVKKNKQWTFPGFAISISHEDNYVIAIALKKE
ncbi:holo-ACP synthase [Mycoplasmopsis agassizii]|uniref:holo-ACP synthase n=1 Tax=Mycoplasmopsis agassizii TaxID=33922 RepID=UPI0035278BB3